MIICGMVFHFLLLNSKQLHAQCSAWDVTAVTETSTCAANGKVTASLTGSGASSLTNVLYSLKSVTAGGYGVEQSASPVFQNVPGGTYRVVVQAICNGVSTQDSVQVSVATTYVAMNVTTRQDRLGFMNCNTGKATVIISGGRAPYTINISGKPAAYIGRTTFSANGNLALDSLVTGTYTISVTDACSSTANTQTLTIGSVVSAAGFGFNLYQTTPGNCNVVSIRDLGTSDAGLASYRLAGTPVEMSYTVGGVTSTFKAANLAPDFITLPAGKSISDYIGTPVQISFRGPCGDIVTTSVNLGTPSVSRNFEYNCAISFSMNYIVYSANSLCYPIYTTLKNTQTNEYRYDTITAYTNSIVTRSIRDLSYGSYNLSLAGADGRPITAGNVGNMTVNPPANTSPYSITVQDGWGNIGNQGHAMFSLNKTSLQTAGTKIELVSPASMAYSYLLPNGGATSYFITEKAGGSATLFEVGSYLFRITDNCGSYDIPVTVREQDVYRYSWSYTTQQTCNGLVMNLGGNAYYQTRTLPLYYKIMSPTGYPTIASSGQTLTLPLPGTYKIAVAGSSLTPSDYGALNTFTVVYENRALGVDVNRSIGWVCPRQPDNQGTIWAYGINGSTANNGKYTFRLAEEGKGNTGPYLATNQDGVFSTATSGGAYTLSANKSYDIKIEDDCGAAAVQPIKIIDFATAQVVSAEKTEYCIGETVRFKVINLPTTATKFFWKGPNGLKAQGNLVIYNFQLKDTGTYRVAITSDMCADSIIGTVNIKVAPYLNVCYSAVTDTSVNPYKYSLLGNWRPVRNYTYYTARAESDPNQETNIRTDGAYADFQPFWQISNGKWTAKKQEQWVWTSESTIFNAKGFELENKDPLGRFNAGLYGYGDAIPTAVVQNSRYQEAAFEGFEDYYFDASNCETVCPGGRRFDFTSYKSRIDSTQRHTGRYSIRVAPGDTVGVISSVMSQPEAFGQPTYNETSISCNGVSSTVLKSVRANSELLLPSFAPLSGKKVLFSAWVKETQDCSCTSYESNQISLAVTNSTNGGSTVLKIKPSGAIIDGWQRYEQVVDVPTGSTGFSVVMIATGSTIVYYDDIRIHPYNANMKSFVYDARNLRMMAELDENNYATFYEYDDDATLTRVKKETERGVKTIKETRSALIKE